MLCLFLADDYAVACSTWNVRVVLELVWTRCRAWRMSTILRRIDAAARLRIQWRLRGGACK